MTLKDLVAACGEAARFFKPYQVGWCHDLRERGLHCLDGSGASRHCVSSPCSRALQAVRDLLAQLSRGPALPETARRQAVGLTCCLHA